MKCKVCKDLGNIPAIIPIKGKVFGVVHWNMCWMCLGGTRDTYRQSQPLVVVPKDGKLTVVKATVSRWKF